MQAAAGRPGTRAFIFVPGQLEELRQNIRPLVAASLGSGVGLLLMSYTTTIFGPYLLKAFGWSRAQFALIGLSMMASLVALPFIGMLTDRAGVRRTALVGVLGIPVCLFGYSVMNGSFAVYFGLASCILILGSFASPVVYTRLIAAKFDKARGIALTCVTIAPALVGAIITPLLNEVIEAWGWRAGYRALGLFVLLAGLGAIALMPAHRAAATQAPDQPRARPLANTPSLSAIVRNRTFWIIFLAMFLCTLQTPLHATQMGIMLQDRGLSGGQMAAMISIYGIGTVLGRFACGVALDRFDNSAVVAAVSMMLPAFGYAALAAFPGATGVIAVSMFLVGIAFGAEGDLQSFLVARHFDIRVFSTALSLVFCGVFAASAISSGLLNATLHRASSFTPFLAGIAAAVFAGSIAFLMLPRAGTAAETGDHAGGE